MQTENKLAGAKILLTGGTTGIGRATAHQLLWAGAKVLIVGREQSHLDELQKDVDKSNCENFRGIVADLSTEDAINKLFSDADSWLGGLDILINNAALAYCSAMDGDYADWHEVINTNLTAYIACAHQAIVRMRDKGKGHIVNIGSMSADVREKNSSVYVATKSGIQGFSESLRKEVNELGIKVTLIEPGAVDTDMQPASTDEKAQSRENLEMLESDDIAAAVLFAVNQPERSDVVSIQIRPHKQMI